MHNSLVWDIYVRLFHWLLVICIGLQWATGEWGEDWLQWHSWIGYFTLGLILFRIIWGFIGSEYARFTTFIPSPNSLKHYVKSTQPIHLSHNPVGALMVVALLITVLIQSVSGLFTTDDIFFNAPLRSMVSAEWQQWADVIHHQSFKMLQILVAIHIAAAFFYLWVKKQNLIKAMVDGRKETDEDKSIKKQHHVRAAVLIILVAALLYIVINVLPPEAVDDFYY